MIFLLLQVASHFIRFAIIIAIFTLEVAAWNNRQDVLPYHTLTFRCDEILLILTLCLMFSLALPLGNVSYFSRLLWCSFLRCIVGMISRSLFLFTRRVVYLGYLQDHISKAYSFCQL